MASSVSSPGWLAARVLLTMNNVFASAAMLIVVIHLHLFPQIRMFVRRTVAKQAISTAKTIYAFSINDHSIRSFAITCEFSTLDPMALSHIRTCAKVAAWLKNCRLPGAKHIHIAGPFPMVIARKEERV